MKTEVSAKKGDPSNGGLVLQRIPDVKSMHQCYGRYLSTRKLAQENLSILINARPVTPFLQYMRSHFAEVVPMAA
jgi:hypothetical protein